MNLPISDTQTNTVSKNGYHPVLAELPTATHHADTQVTAQPARRRLTAEYKRRILSEAEGCTQPGQLGALMRREGLYSSSLASFRKQRDNGKLGQDPQKTRQVRQEKEAARQRDARKIASLEAENNKLKVLLELQKKVAELMNLSLQNATQE